MIMFIYLDVVDGVFPETVPKDLKTMNKTEQGIYEEERRLFYVGVTRAKSMLSVFKLNQKSTFCQELMHKEKAITEKRAFSSEEFKKFLDAIGDGLIVKHKKLGEGVVVEMQGDKVLIQFDDGERLFGLKALYEYDLLQII